MLQSLLKVNICNSLELGLLKGGDFSKLGARISKGAKGGDKNLNFLAMNLTYTRYSWVAD